MATEPILLGPDLVESLGIDARSDPDQVFGCHAMLPAGRLDFHDFFFFTLSDFVDRCDEFVRQYLDLIFAAVEFVL